MAVAGPITRILDCCAEWRVRRTAEAPLPSGVRQRAPSVLAVGCRAPSNDDQGPRRRRDPPIAAPPVTFPI